MGGGNMTAALAPHFGYGFASDVLPDLALLYQALQRGWQPPSVVSEAEYAALRHAPPSAERAFAGFGCSFGGKWFGGYARSNVARNYASNARNGLLKQAAAFGNVEFRTASYDSLPVMPGAVYYCDPPYASTTGYACGGFDHAKFWAVMRVHREAGAQVYVSEYAAPADWTCVWEKQKQISAACS